MERTGIISRVFLLLLLATLQSCGEEYTPTKAKEGVLRQDLYAMRSVLDQYVMDKGTRPQSLDALVHAGYLKKIPVDPMTGRNDSWVLERSSNPTQPGIVNIRSSSRSTSRDGTAYSTW